MSYLRGVFRIAFFLLLCIAVLIIHGIGRIFGKYWSFPQRLCVWLCRAFGFLPRMVGTPISNQPVFFAANHVSYLDIPALSACMDVSFVAKSEVAGWPLIGTLARIQNTVFIKRTRTALEGIKEAVADLFRAGKSVVVFAEGTSTDGRSVNPFKPGLFDAVYEEGTNAVVQPVAIVLEAVEGQPISTPQIRDRYAWWRPEHTLVPHLWAFACTKKTGIAIHFLPPLNPKDYADRKDLAQAAHGAVKAVVEAGAGLGYNPASDVPVAQLDRAPVS